MDNSGSKFLILVAARSGEEPSSQDLAAVRNLRDRIGQTTLDQVSVVIAPRLMGHKKDSRVTVADSLLRPHQGYDRPFIPELLNAGYVESRLRRLPETRRAVLLVVPVNELNAIAAALTRDDGRRTVTAIRDRAARPIEPGTGIVAEYRGKWSEFKPRLAQSVRYSCPSNPQCIEAPPVFNVTRRGAVLAAALGFAAIVRRPVKEP